jgi:hypothetical protein
MFEGKPPKQGRAASLDTGLDSGLDSSAGDADSLHEISWDDLVSRLVAARDLRAELNQSDHCPASFHARSARRIAELRDGEHSINPDDLGNRKGTCRKEGATDQQNINGAPRN